MTLDWQDREHPAGDCQVTPLAAPRKIGVYAHPGGSTPFACLDALEGVFPVRFVPLGEPRSDGLDALILVNSSRSTAEGVARRGLPCLCFTSSNGSTRTSVSVPVEFSSSGGVPRVLRGERMWEGNAEEWPPLSAEPGDEVLCTRAGGVAWLKRRESAGFYYLASAELPTVGAGEYLCRHFSSGNFMRLLPLLSFLQEVCGDAGLQNTAIRACMVFDDPSLWWRSYGFINFKRLVQKAREHGFHVAIATIPLASRFASRAVVSLIREHRDQISLVVHGNNHSWCELASGCDCTACTGLMAQALERVEHFEAKFGAHIGRVMEPPHGVCRREYLEALHRLGFDGVLATRDLVVRNHRPGELPPGFGLAVSEIFPGAVPALPRIRLTPFWRTDVLLGAFLGQPVVVAGHHMDLADGFGFLEDLASLVNRLPGAQWMSLPRLLETNCQSVLKGEVLQARMYARRIRMRVPPGARWLVIHRPWLSGSGQETLNVRRLGKDARPNSEMRDAGELISVEGGSEIEVLSESANHVRWQDVPRPGTPWRLLARIALMEARDRSYPLRYPFRWLRQEPRLKAGYPASPS